MWEDSKKKRYPKMHNKQIIKIIMMIIWVGKKIHWEVCKKFKFDHTNKWYMRNRAPVLENGTYKLLWDFDIQTDHLISAKRLELIIIFKKMNLKNGRIWCPSLPQNKTECEKKDKYQDLAWQLKKNMEHESDNYTNYDRCFWHNN